MTTSPAAAAAIALGAACPPFSANAAVAVGTRSKPVTWCWALTRLAAIGAPMLPNPIKPIVAMAALLFARAACDEIYNDAVRQGVGTMPDTPTVSLPHCETL